MVGLGRGDYVEVFLMPRWGWDDQFPVSGMDCCLSSANRIGIFRISILHCVDAVIGQANQTIPRFHSNSARQTSVHSSIRQRRQRPWKPPIKNILWGDALSGQWASGSCALAERGTRLARRAVNGDGQIGRQSKGKTWVWAQGHRARKPGGRQGVDCRCDMLARQEIAVRNEPKLRDKGWGSEANDPQLMCRLMDWRRLHPYHPQDIRQNMVLWYISIYIYTYMYRNKYIYIFFLLLCLLCLLLLFCWDANVWGWPTSLALNVFPRATDWLCWGVVMLLLHSFDRSV